MDVRGRLSLSSSLGAKLTRFAEGEGGEMPAMSGLTSTTTGLSDWRRDDMLLVLLDDEVVGLLTKSIVDGDQSKA